MRTPRTLAGRVAILLSTLAILVGIAVGVVLVLRPHPPTAGSDLRSEPFVPAPFEGPILARVDGAPLYVHEAELRISGLTSLHGDISEVMGDDWSEVILSSLVDDQLIRAEATKTGISVTRSEVADSLHRVQEMAGSPERFQDWLDEQGLTLPELERRIWMQALSGAVYREVTSGVQVTGEELRDYYRANRTAYEGVDGVVLPFIAVRSSIRAELEEQLRQDIFSAWLEKAREEAEIELVDEDWWKEVS